MVQYQYREGSGHLYIFMFCHSSVFKQFKNQLQNNKWAAEKLNGKPKYEALIRCSILLNILQFKLHPHLL